MATMVVETGSGVSGANSYCSTDDADTYHEMRLHNTDWTTLTSSSADIITKEKALMWATNILDSQVNWNGYATNSDQSLRWPRQGVYTPDFDLISDSAVPDFLKEATAEFALHLIGSDRTADTTTLGYKKLKAGPIELDVDAIRLPAVIPRSVWSLIRPYCTKLKRKRSLVRM